MMLKVTASLLLSQGACEDQVQEFDEDFPEGLILNSKTTFQKLRRLFLLYDPGCKILANLFCEEPCYMYKYWSRLPLGCGSCPFSLGCIARSYRYFLKSDQHAVVMKDLLQQR